MVLEVIQEDKCLRDSLSPTRSGSERRRPHSSAPTISLLAAFYNNGSESLHQIP